MKGFEVFDLRSWLFDGLTKHVESNDRKARSKSAADEMRKRVSQTRVAVAVVAAALGVTTFSASPASAAQLAFDFVQPAPLSAGDDSIADPVTYWPRLAREISTWPQLEEPVTEDIPPAL